MKCSFCGSDIPKGTGKMFVYNTGTIFYFCSSKCQKQQLKLKHKPEKTNWTEGYKKAKTVRLHTLQKGKTKEENIV